MVILPGKRTVSAYCSRKGDRNESSSSSRSYQSGDKEVRVRCMGRGGQPDLSSLTALALAYYLALVVGGALSPSFIPSFIQNGVSLYCLC